MSLVIADSSVISRERLIRSLADLEGVEIAGQASDIPEARDLAQKLKPDVIILDLGLPGGTDVELLSVVKKLHPAPKVIVLDNSRSPEVRADCIFRGADYLFDKSAEIDRVASVLRGMHRVMDAR
jgi:DNA-binding NarL/FixJ family response regulator